MFRTHTTRCLDRPTICHLADRHVFKAEGESSWSVHKGSCPVCSGFAEEVSLDKGHPKEVSLERSACILEKGYLMLGQPRIESWRMLG